MSTCDVCGQAVERVVVPDYTTDLFGIPIHVFNSVERNSCGCSEADFVIPFPELLQSAAAVCRAGESQRLNGTEIRFLRKAVGFSSKKMARQLSVDPATLSRWENGSKPMGQSSEKLLRLTVVIALGEQAPAVDVKAKDVVGMSLEGFAAPDRCAPLSLMLTKYKQERLYTDHENVAVA